MCNLNFKKYETKETLIKVLPIEKEVNELCNGKHGTIDTVTFIKNNFNVEVHLIIGEDAYRDICANKWKEGHR